MTRICLIRHTTSIVDPAVTADLWNVTAEGRRRVVALFPALAEQGVDLIVTSPERKAVITGEILAHGLHLRRKEAAGLSEQSWSRVPFLPELSAFTEAVRQHFATPNEAIFGEEPSRDAAIRFDRTVRDVLAGPQPPQVPAFVSHGRIMSAWIAKLTGEDAFVFWQSLQMPDAFIVDLEQQTWQRMAND
jgi:broad specificity phosphatase PhoE